MSPLPPPRVSVLLPARNAAATLDRCLRSLERQSEEDWECVLVDDGSSDGTAALAAAWGARDARVRVEPLAHRGLVGALNHGLSRCRGRWVARMDADDLMHRHRLRDQLAWIGRNGWDGAGCHVRMFPRSALGPGIREYEDWLNRIADEGAVRREAWVECPLAHPSWLIRRELLAEHGYRDRAWPEDYDLLLRLLAAGARLGVVPLRRLCWRHGAGRLSRASPSYAAERFTACRAHHLARTFLAGGERYALWGYGRTGRMLRRALAEEGKQVAYIVEIHPGRLGNRIHGAAVISPEELPRAPRLPLLVSVARRSPREEIRTHLAGAGFRESVDFVCCA